MMSLNAAKCSKAGAGAAFSKAKRRLPLLICALLVGLHKAPGIADGYRENLAGVGS
jgi:hypothetical protein